MAILEARPAVDIWVVCPAKQRRRLTRALRGSSRVHPVYFPEAKGSLSPWACDDGKPMRDGGLFISKGDAHRIETRNAHIVMAQQMDIRLVGSPIVFDGGDVLCGERHVFVGEHTLDRNKAPGRSSLQLARKLGKLFDKPTIVLETPVLRGTRFGKRFRYCIHVDQEIGLLFDPKTKVETALVSDPRTLIEVALGLAASSVNHRRGFAAAVRRMLLERSLGDYFTDASVADNWEASLRARRHARTLRRHGYPVRFVPGFVGSAPPLEHHIEEISDMRMLNYVNGVVDRGVVYLPWLELPAVDTWVTRLVEGLGYDVIPMRSARYSYTLLGGPHCLMSAARAAK